MTLPIEEALPGLLAALAQAGQAVLQAPPGAGKTTRVPLALLEEGRITGRILMLEPRRIATRAAAERMADTLGEPVGARVGYRMRGEAKTSPETRIEVVTEGILTRMIQSSPDLEGIGCVVFDEFHERSIHADLGLALCLEIREALRPDLHLLVMSATLDAEPVAQLMGDAPLITSAGRAFPVTLHHAEQPPRRDWRGFAPDVAETIHRALAHNAGSALVFLPGAGEIRAVARALGPLPENTMLCPLYGGLPFKEQRRAIRPAPTGQRKVVLATSIAETSLTIEDVRIVIDAGLARRARYDPGSGMSRLVTERVTKAEATQRQGRAGRVAAGTCYRMWTKGEEGALAAFPPPEIAAADLAPLALDLALWGADTLPFLTPPPEGTLAEARGLLQRLGALDTSGQITAHGRAMAKLPTHPRLAHMLLAAPSRQTAQIAALLSGRDILRGADQADMGLRLKVLAGQDRGAADPSALSDAQAEAARLARLIPKGGDGAQSAGAILSLAYPDRIGLRRAGDAPRFLLSGGKGAALRNEDALAGQRMLVAADLDGDQTEARIRMALPVSESEIRALHADRLREVRICEWSRRHRRVEARERLMLDALVLEDRRWPNAPEDAIAMAAAEGVGHLGLSALGWSKAALRLRGRVMWLRQRGSEEMPDLSDAALAADLDWLMPYLGRCRDADALYRLDPLPALEALLDWPARQMLDTLAPTHFTAPTGSRVAIDYDGEGGPALAIRLQEMFGLSAHPTIGPDHVPLRIDLLSPAGRPVQMTSDLPGFWASSYADVRRDMRGRYPRHPWPEDPLTADPTRRAKPRGT
ncbi:ATP-dependent helicase HrpB [Rubricella aquisinus]|uniref:ATP-dependent helicase HrpB n=1 Tax=Rubricella aquisinus TaxID=2028108 RepID=A0A840WLQ2_9RHOB|nr:ATP-dependent helicase HrpB [Rubricella aquisinus]MBB5514582.1 ATP-dependent helicase HrpB [Rubricella aquisinus]